MTAPEQAIERLVISAPFGNYVRPAGATPTLGTFTANPRPGRWLRALTTIRFYRRERAWVNRIGLRNPGIEWLCTRVGAGRAALDDKIVSVHGLDEEEWWRLLDRMRELRPLAIELNMSCPNVGEINWPGSLFARAVGTGVRTIVKLPPLRYEGILESALEAGVRSFHCCNTLPVRSGGLSGKPLKPYSLRCLRNVRDGYSGTGGSELMLIGGGGITCEGDIDDYADAGATHVAVGTLAMNPLRLVRDGPLGVLARHANARLGTCC